MQTITWIRGWLSAELFDGDGRSLAHLDRPLMSGGWELDYQGERFLIRRPHWFSRDYRVTNARTGSLVAEIHLPVFFMRSGGRINLQTGESFEFRYTNFWKRHFRFFDPSGQEAGGTEEVSLFGWSGRLLFRDDVPVLAGLLAYFMYLRLSIRRRAARS